MVQLRKRMLVRGEVLLLPPQATLHPAYVENLMTYTVHAEFELKMSIGDLVWKKEGKMVR
jgi:hypothetical protein